MEYFQRLVKRSHKGCVQSWNLHWKVPLSSFWHCCCWLSLGEIYSWLYNQFYQVSRPSDRSLHRQGFHLSLDQQTEITNLFVLFFLFWHFTLSWTSCELFDFHLNTELRCAVFSLFSCRPTYLHLLGWVYISLFLCHQSIS